MAAAALAIVAWHLAGPRQVRSALTPESITAWKEHGSTYRLDGSSWFVDSGGDSGASPTSSTLKLLENGKELGPAHSVHQNVATYGRGAYSHWGNTVYFSASDNSDPRANGRRYEATYRLAPARWLVALALAALGCVAAWAAWPILRGRVLGGPVPLLPAALGLGAMLATLTHWLPIPGQSQVAHDGLPPLARIGVSQPGDRPGVAKLLPFDRLVRPLLIVPSPNVRSLQVSQGGSNLREVPTIDEFRGATDAVFLDADRIGGDGVLVYLPPGPAVERSSMRIEYGAVVTRGAILALWGAFGVSIAAAVAVRRSRQRDPRERRLLASAHAAGSAGIALIVLNLSGLAFPVRPAQEVSFPSPELGPERKPPRIAPTTLESALLVRPGEGRADYAVRMNDLVAENVHHIWNYANASSFALHVPMRSNFVLSLLGEASPAMYRYTYAAWRPALERGVGMCSQKTLILVGLLRERDYDARIVQLDGHTVVTAEVEPGKWYVLDPDYGVSLRRDLPSIEADPESVREAYRTRLEQVRHPEPAFGAGVVTGFYERAGNHVEPKGGNQMLGEAWVWRERIAGILKWALPLALVAAAAGLLMHARRRRTAADTIASE